MPATSPVRVDAELYRSAQLVGDIMSRSAAQQITHWARIGRALEASADVSTAHIAEVLTGDRDYDTLDSDEQALVRAMWAERFGRLHQQLDLAATFAAEGHTYAELDDDGNIVTIAPSAGT